MKKYLVILMIFFITAGGWNLFADSAFSPIINQAEPALLSGHFLKNCFPGLSLDAYFLGQDPVSAMNAGYQFDTLAVNAPKKQITAFNHGGLFASLITFAVGFGLYVGGGAAASMDLGLALLLMYIGVPVNCAGCLLSDVFLQSIHNSYKAKGAKIKEDNILWSWVLTGVGVALFAGSIAIAIIEPSFTGSIISISLGCGAMIVNVLDFYLVKPAWLKDINAAI